MTALYFRAPHRDFSRLLHSTALTLSTLLATTDRCSRVLRRSSRVSGKRGLAQ